jgi:NAD(P)H-flavin reductase
MCRAQVDSPVKVSGPLGRGPPNSWKRNPLYLVGGGIGLAPMGMVLGQPGATAHLFYGERSGDLQVDEAWLKAWAGDLTATVDDGSGYGRAGLVTGPLEEALGREVRPIFACGPKPMLVAVSALAARYNAPVLVSVEAGMACGFGVCLSCSLPLKNGGRFRACQEGPVVDGSTVDWGKM